MQDWKIGNMLVVLAVVVGLIGGVAVLHGVLPAEPSRYKDLVGIIQSGAIAAALIIGGIIANAKLELFRHLEPHLTIAHTVSHRPVGNGYVHIAVKAVLCNSSRVVVKLRDGRFLLRHIITAPEAASSGTTSKARSPVDNVLYPQLPILDEASFDLGDQEISIEPGQTIQEVLQFIVSDEVKTVLIHYFFHDSRFPDDPLRGWGITDVYDML